MVDKPRRRKQREVPWLKIGGVVLAGLIVVGTSWYVYNNYIYKPPPVYATIDTTMGSIQVELFPACAPQTVANFVKLADSGFYDNVTWHRIVPGFVIQTGDPNTRFTTLAAWNASRSSWGSGGSNKTVPLEVCGWLHNYAGYLAMARHQDDPNSGTSQFYINLSNSSSNLGLDGNYTVFGRVVQGMSVVNAIAAAPTYTSLHATQPINPVLVKDIVIQS